MICVIIRGHVNTQRHREFIPYSHVMAETEIVVMQLKPKDCRQPSELEERPRRFFSLEFSDGVWPVDTLILTSGLQNCKKINFYNFKLYTVYSIFFLW